MITYLPVEKVTEFVNEYSLNKCPDIYAGTEGTTFFVRDYYKITDLPFLALYNKNGDFIKSYSKDVPLKNLSERLNNLK
jgi:hypothetical protein